MVDTIIPPNTVVPTECRLADPAPEAKTSGSTPRMKANDVIRMGRSRIRAAFDRSVRDRHAFVSQLFRELDDQNPVLAGESNQHDKPDLAVHIIDQPARRLRHQVRPGSPSARSRE